MATVFEKPKSLTDTPFHYCPGCPHGIIHRLVAEVMDELDIEGKEKEKIEAIYQQTREECMSVDFDILFSVILNFLVERKYPNALSGEQIDELSSKFMFFMASQDFYPFLVGTKG